MNEDSHRRLTAWAADLANHMRPGLVSAQEAASLVESAGGADWRQDLEFVDVQFGRDDPHVRDFPAVNDRAHFMTGGFSHSALTHFIDIRKGPGRFDDYDGYAYHRGSGCVDEFQPAAEAISGWGRWLAELVGGTVDAGINYWLNDEYAHAPGQPGYRRCSPALERYSFPGDLGRYAGRTQEARERYPLAEATGGTGLGVPYSVFPPVDNLARWWYARALRMRSRRAAGRALGMVLHAVQDASIPHHAAGCNGNWHRDYERDLDLFSAQPEAGRRVRAAARTHAAEWLKHRGRAPRRMDAKHLRSRPGPAWPVEALVTWMALRAFRAYAETYRNFRKGFAPNRRSQTGLLSQALAVSALVLIKAAQDRRRDAGQIRSVQKRAWRAKRSESLRRAF